MTMTLQVGPAFCVAMALAVFAACWAIAEAYLAGKRSMRAEIELAEAKAFKKGELHALLESSNELVRALGPMPARQLADRMDAMAKVNRILKGGRS